MHSNCFFEFACIIPTCFVNILSRQNLKAFLLWIVEVFISERQRIKM